VQSRSSSRQRLLKVPRREAPQVQHRQHLGDLGRASHVGRQDPACEPLPPTRRVDPPVIHPGRLHGQCPRAASHRPGPSLPIAHHQRVPAGVPLLVALEIGGDFHLERVAQHLSRSLQRNIIERLGAERPFQRLRVSDCLQHGWRLLPPGANQGFVWVSHGRVRRPFHVFNPQLLTITLPLEPSTGFASGSDRAFPAFRFPSHADQCP
jgi:hypothetical protein